METPFREAEIWRRSAASRLSLVATTSSEKLCSRWPQFVHKKLTDSEHKIPQIQSIRKHIFTRLRDCFRPHPLASFSSFRAFF